MRLYVSALVALCATHLLAADSRPPVEIGTAKGVAGQAVRGSLVVAEAADGSPVALPVVVVTGRETGPVVWVEASAHGDEYGGPRALQDVVRGLDPATMKGTVVAVMITNVPAFRGPPAGEPEPRRSRGLRRRVSRARPLRHGADRRRGLREREARGGILRRPAHGRRPLQAAPVRLLHGDGHGPGGSLRRARAQLRRPDAVARHGEGLRERLDDGARRRRDPGVPAGGRRRAAARPGGHPHAGRRGPRAAAQGRGPAGSAAARCPRSRP